MAIGTSAPRDTGTSPATDGNGTHIMAKSNARRTPATVKPRTPKPAATPATPAPTTFAGMVATIVTMVRAVTVDNVTAIVARANAGHTPTNRNTGRYTGRRIMAFQNESLIANNAWQLDDLQIAALWAIEFPGAVGRVFGLNGRMGAVTPAVIMDAVSIVRGVRADYNRTGHGMYDTKRVPDVIANAFGPKRIVIPNVTPATPAKTA